MRTVLDVIEALPAPAVGETGAELRSWLSRVWADFVPRDGLALSRTPGWGMGSISFGGGGVVYGEGDVGFREIWCPRLQLLGGEVRILLWTPRLD